MKMLLTKKFTFEMAHALPGYEGKCANLHGHSYHLEVTVEGSGCDEDGMVLDFHKIKELVQQAIITPFDHALVLQEGSPLTANRTALPNLIEVPFAPTTERLLIHFASLLTPLMPQGTRLHSLQLAETETSVAKLIL